MGNRDIPELMRPFLLCYPFRVSNRTERDTTMLLLLDTRAEDAQQTQAEIESVLESLRNLQASCASSELSPEINDLPDIDLDNCHISITLTDDGAQMLEISPLA